MNPTLDAGSFALQFIADIAVFFFILRFALRFADAQSNSPFVYTIARITNPLCTPVARFFPYSPRWDFAALLWAFVIQAVYFSIKASMAGAAYAPLMIAILAVAGVLSAIFTLYFLTIIAEAVLSFVRPVHSDANLSFIGQVNRPILAPFRKLLPNMGGVDLSPLIALFAIKIVEIFVVGSLNQLAMNVA